MIGDDLAMGMPRDAVRIHIGTPYEACRATKFGEAQDIFLSSGVVARFDDGEHLSELEFIGPAVPILCDIRPIGMHIQKVLRHLVAAGIAPWRTTGLGHYNCDDLGVGMWVEDDDEGTVTSFVIRARAPTKRGGGGEPLRWPV